MKIKQARALWNVRYGMSKQAKITVAIADFLEWRHDNKKLWYFQAKVLRKKFLMISALKIADLKKLKVKIINSDKYIRSFLLNIVFT